MPAKLDMVIIGSGPGGLAAGLLAKKHSKSFIILEKGSHTMQGITDTYPKGKKVYPTIPKSYPDPFPVLEIKPPDEKIPVEKALRMAKSGQIQDGKSIGSIFLAQPFLLQSNRA